MQNIKFWDNFLYVKFLWGIFLQIVVLLKNPVKSSKKTLKDCDLFWRLHGVILEPGA